MRRSIGFFCLNYGRRTWSNCNRLQSITLFHVILISIDYIKKNYDVIDYIELAFKCGNSICDITCCRLYSDKPVVLNLFGPWIISLKENI